VSLAAGDQVTLPLVGAESSDGGSGTPSSQARGDAVAHGGTGGGCSCALAARPVAGGRRALALIALGLGGCAFRRRRRRDRGVDNEMRARSCS
jgi:hypothetical protein